jgi:hypothetical protein
MVRKRQVAGSAADPGPAEAHPLHRLCEPLELVVLRDVGEAAHAVVELLRAHLRSESAGARAVLRQVAHLDGVALDAHQILHLVRTVPPVHLCGR